MLYPELNKAFRRLDGRHTRYRFDLESDMPWDQLDAPGHHLGDAFLASVGIDAAGLAAHPEAFALFQWAVGLEISQAFSALEGYLLDFVDEEHTELKTTRSIELLYEEERKHIALFDRYAAHLRAQHPEWIPGFDAAFEPYRPALLNPYNREAYPSGVVQHYFFWLKTVFFEEYTIYLHQRFETEAETMQPAWVIAHELHRREEVQHVATDAGYLAALDMSNVERRACAKAFWANFEATFNLFLGVAASRDLVRTRFPEVAQFVPLLSTREMPIFGDLVTHPAFRRTREAAPGLEVLARTRTGATASAWTGPELSIPAGAPRTLVDALDEAIAAEPTTGVTYIHSGGSERHETYGVLKRRALDMLDAYRLRGVAEGSPVVLAADDAESFFPSYWACLLGGLLPVPMSGPASADRAGEALQKLKAVLARLGAGTPIVAPSTLAQFIRPVVGAAHPVWTTDELLAHRATGEVAVRACDAEDLAMVQFSSGSTGQPKGIQLTHANLLHNTRAILAHQVGSADDSFVSWLPLFHDMGLIGYHLLPIVAGARQAHMHPLHFVSRPMDWLEAMHRHQATVTASPNFGLAHLLNRLDVDRVPALDLSHLHCILNGAEPIAAAVMKRFTTALAPAGLRPEVMSPAYGLAEGTLCLVAKPKGSASRVHHIVRDSLVDGTPVVSRSTASDETAPFVSVGTPIHGVSLRLVDADGALVAPGLVGHVEVRGANVTQGYLGDAAATDAAFRDGWLCTGDLAVWIDDALVITGREKDVLFVGGRNVYAHDIESVVATVDGVRPGRVVAVAVSDEESGRDRICVALAVREEASAADVLAEVEAVVTRTFGFELERTEIVPSRELPRTTSGKLQRHLVQARFARDLGATVSSEPGPLPPVEVLEPEPVEVETAPSIPEGWTAAALTDLVRSAWAEALGRPEESFANHARFKEVGGTSLKAAHIHTLLEDALDLTLSHELLIDAGTIDEMVAWLVAQHPEIVAKRAPEVPEVVTPVAPEPDEVLTPEVVFDPQRDGDIAIVGLGVRLPGADGVDAFWDMLEAGRDAFRPVPATRWDHAEFTQTLTDEGHAVCPTGAFMDDVFGFDPSAFGMAEAEAARTNPQYRLFMEAAAEAMTDAGVGRGRVGVFASQGEAPSNFRSFLDEIARDGLNVTGQLGNSTNNMVAAQLNRTFGLTGPAMVVQAACASSLVAVHQARRALQHDECDVAIAGGVELLHTPTLYALFAPAGVLSTAGACRPFSDAADGFVPGEGAAVVALKRLDRAHADGDRIYAVIKGSSIGNDGQTFGEMAPNPAGQLDVMRRALDEAAIDPATVDLIETHGTATPVGDIVELRALQSVYDAGSDAPCGLGSVKSNVGHLLAGAGTASLVKICLAFDRQVQPPIAGFERPGRRMSFTDTRLHPLANATPWPTGGETPRRAAINSLGIGGTNCHVVLEEAPHTRRAQTDLRDARLLCLSAHDASALQRVAASYAAMLRQDATVSMTDFAATVNRRANLRRHRIGLVVSDVQDAIQQLDAVANGDREGRQGSDSLAFLFPGPGSQTQGMAAALRHEPVFAEALAACDAVAAPLLGTSLWTALDETATEGQAGMDQIALAQPVVFAVSYATSRWLASVGVTPDVVLGHSAGEYAAACAAGILDVRDALTALITRGDAMSQTAPGTMAAVFADQAEVERLTARFGGRVVIAAYNGPRQLVLSGPASDMAQLMPTLTSAGITAKPLAISCGAHSPLMETAMPALQAALNEVTFRPSAVPFISSRTAALVEQLDAHALTRQLREPVRFAESIARAIDLGHRTFVELGGTAVLSPVVETVGRARGATLHTAAVHRRSQGGWAPALTALATLFEAGRDLRFGHLTSHQAHVALPAYPYERKQLTVPFAAEQVRTAPGAKQAAPEPVGATPLSAQTLDLFQGHRADGEAIAPAAWMMDKLLAVSGKMTLKDLLVRTPLQGQRTWQVTEVDGDHVLQSVDASGDERLHLSAREAHASGATLPVVRESADAASVSVDAIYQALSDNGLDYGPAFRTIECVTRDGDDLWVDLMPREAREVSHIDPTILDGAFQAMAAFQVGRDGHVTSPFLGFAAREVRWHRPVTGPCHAHIRLKSTLSDDATSIRVDISLRSAAGEPLLELLDFAAKRRDREVLFAFGLGWEPVTMPTVGHPPALGRVAVVDTTASEAMSGLVEVVIAENAGVAFGPFSDLAGAATVAALRQAELVVAATDSPEELFEVLRAVGRDGHAGRVVVTTTQPSVVAMTRSFGAEHPGIATATVLHRGGLDTAALLSVLSTEGDDVVLRRKEGQWQRPMVTPTPMPSAEALTVRPDGVYWVVGGGSGIGLATAEALAQRGARALVLSGRREQPNPVSLDRLRATGAEVLWLSLDVSDAEAVHAARDRILTDLGALHGVVHSAGVLDDGPLVDRDANRVRAVLAPKVLGGPALASALHDLDLDFLGFVSSLSARVPSPGQCDYAAGNGTLDAVASRFDGAARHVVSVAFGPWGQTGMVADEAHRRALRARGLPPMGTAVGVDALLGALAGGARELVVTALASGAASRLADAVAGTPPQPMASKPEVSLAAPVASPRPAAPAVSTVPVAVASVAPPSVDLLALVRDGLAVLLRREVTAASDDQPFSELGVDSLMAVELIRRIEGKLDVELHPTLLFEHPTPVALVAYLRTIAPAAAASTAPVAAVEEAGTAEVSNVECYFIESTPEAVELTVGHTESPAVGPHDVAIHVKAWGVNFIDVLAGVGLHPVIRDERWVPGHEVAGRVVAVGSDVTDIEPGDRVMALLERGGYARQVVTPRHLVMALPQPLTFTEGAGVLVTGLTAIACVEEAGRVVPGDRVLVQSAAGATGQAVVQLALHHGAEVYGTASSDAKLEVLRQLGVQYPINYIHEDFAEAVASRAGQVDVIVDALAGDAVTRGMSVLADGGRFIEMGAGVALEVAGLDPQTMFLRNQTFSGVNISQVMRRPEHLARLMARLAELLTSGALRPQVGHCLTFAQAADAHALLRSRRSIGKVVLAA